MRTSSPRSADARIGCAALRVALDRATPRDLQALLQTQGDACIPDRFVAWCRYQGIVPSVARVLARIDDPVAQRLHHGLQPHSQTIAGASLLQAEALREILACLAAHDIDVIPLKGVGLDVRCYGGPGRRKDGDHDLLVRPQQLADAVRAVREIGYERGHAPKVDPNLPAERWADEIAIHHGPPLVKHDGPMPSWIEFHWDVAPETEGLPFRSPRRLTEALWKRSRAETLLDVPIRQLAPSDEVLYLCVHAIRHLSWHGAGLSVRLAMLEDIARRAWHAPRPDWQTVAARAEELGPFHVLAPIRYLWTAALGAPSGTLVPHDVLADMPWPRSAWKQRVLSPRVLLGDASVPGWAHAADRTYIEKAHRVLMHSVLLHNARDRWRLLQEELLAPLVTVSEADRQHVPPGVPDAAVLPLRWARLGWKALRSR